MIVDMLNACPVLKGRFDLEDGPTVVIGAVAQSIKQGRLSPEEADSVFVYWNELAVRADKTSLDILGPGALELFNDDAASQRLARAKLKGKALWMLEEFRLFWGQPDYGMDDAT
ncbi:MAG TPA: hypothetical protein VGD32_07115 [Brevundimonas sp.]